MFFAPGFSAPPNSDYSNYHAYIDEFMPAESPHLYGLHPNAEIGVLTTRSEHLFRTIFEMQPRDAGSQSGNGLSREEKVFLTILSYPLDTIFNQFKVKAVLEDIVDKIPEQFNIPELMSKVEERTPFVVVAFQECERMNALMGEIKRSLKELELGLKVFLK